MMKPLSLYIHLPFCEQKCNYCDFVSYSGKDKLQGRYIAAIIKQIMEYAPHCNNHMVDTIYLGGGTPTRVKEEYLEILFEAVYKAFNVAEDCEITSEANPASSMKKTLQFLWDMGVNRLSLGGQSANDDELKMLGRTHKFNDLVRTVRDAKEVGFEDINIDIMFSLPDQTPEKLSNTIKEVVKLKPTHISAYSLKIEYGTPFYKVKGELNLPNEEEDRELYELCVRELAENGYSQYEISNFCRDNKISKHNYKNWRCEEYIGLGVSAHSYFNDKRFSFVDDMDVFLNQVEHNGATIKELIEIPYDERVNEYIMLGLRLNEGINDKTFKERFDFSFSIAFKPLIDKFLASGHMVKNGDNYALTLEGFNISNYIISQFIEE